MIGAAVRFCGAVTRAATVIALTALAVVVLRAPLAHAASAPLDRPSVLLARPLPADSGRADVAAGVLPVAGGAIITGWVTRGEAPADGLILRVNGDGDVLWRREVGGDGADLLWTAEPDGDGGFVCVGFTSSRGAGSTDGWFVRFDSTGSIRSQHTYGGPGEDRLTRMRRDSTGWMLVGQRASGHSSLGTQAWVLRIDAAGTERTSWTWGGHGTDRAFGIEPVSGGGCVISGLTGENREVASSFITRLGPDGREVWTHRERRPGLQIGYDVSRGAGETLVIAGYGFTSAARDRDGFVLRLDAAGRVLSRRVLGGATYDRIDQALTFDDGSMAVLGYSQRPGATDDEGAWDMVVHHLDARGAETWTGRFGGAGVEFGRAMAGTLDELWVVGHTTSSRSGSAVYLLQLDLRSARAPARR